MPYFSPSGSGVLVNVSPTLGRGGLGPRTCQFLWCEFALPAHVKHQRDDPLARKILEDLRLGSRELAGASYRSTAQGQ